MQLGNDHDCWLSLSWVDHLSLYPIHPGVHRLWQSLEFSVTWGSAKDSSFREQAVCHLQSLC